MQKIMRILTALDQGKNVFFNITFFKNQGLVTEINKFGTSNGEKVIIGHTYKLTEKARMLLCAYTNGVRV